MVSKLKSLGLGAPYIYCRLSVTFLTSICYSAANPLLSKWQYIKIDDWAPYAVDIATKVFGILFILIVYNRYVKSLVKHYQVFSNILLVVELCIYTANFIIDNPTFYFWSSNADYIIFSSSFCSIEDTSFSRFYEDSESRSVFSANLNVIRQIGGIIGGLLGLLLSNHRRVLLIILVIASVVDNREGWWCQKFLDNSGNLQNKSD